MKIDTQNTPYSNVPLKYKRESFLPASLPEKRSIKAYASAASERPDRAPSQLVHKLKEIRRSFFDSVLGVGHYFSRIGESFLFRRIAPRIALISRGAARGIGGLITTAAGAFRFYSAAKKDLTAGSKNFPRTRKELAMTVGGAVAAFAVGETGYYLTAAAIAFNLPAAAVTGLVGGTIITAGVAAYKTRTAIGSFFSKHRS